MHLIEGIEKLHNCLMKVLRQGIFDTAQSTGSLGLELRTPRLVNELFNKVAKIYYDTVQHCSVPGVQFGDITQIICYLSG